MKRSKLTFERKNLTVPEYRPQTPANPERHLAAAKAPAKLWRYTREISVEANWTPFGTDYQPKFSSAA